MEKEINISDHEVNLFLDELTRNGYDFSGYSDASLKRRIARLFSLEKFPDFKDFQNKILHNPGYLQHVIQEITVNVTEMFRDPSFYKFLRKQIVPSLAGKPLVKIWHAGCSTGEEVYSMAIMLKEEQLLERSLLYATDINPTVLEKFRKGIYPLNQLRQFSMNYIMSGGVNDFSSYYTALYDWVKFDERLRKKMILSAHNLVSDNSFNEFQMIVCRNVLIYFDRDLQNKVFNLFDQSLEPGGFLCLGSGETLKYSSIGMRYKSIGGKEKIWQKLS